MAIDARDNLGAEMMMARNLGGDIGTTIGNYQKFKYNQRIEQETQAGIVMISQRKAADPDYSDDDALRDIDGLPARVREIVRQEYEARENAKLDREYQKARIKYLSEGGASGGAGGDLKTFTTYQKIANDATKQLNDARTIAKVNKTELDPAMVAFLEGQIEYGWRGMSQFMQQTSAAPVTGEDVDAVTMAAPVTGQSPLPSQPSNEMATLADQWLQPQADYSGQQTPRTPNPAKAGPGAFGGFGAGSMGVPPSPGRTAVAGQTPQQTKADAAIAKEIAPDTQLAPSTQAEPQSGQYIKTAVNPETGQRMGFNGKEWVLIQ